MKSLSRWLLLLFCGLLPLPAAAYHPLSTDDPGTTEYRHFELEWGNEFFWPEGSLEESAGYLSIKSGLAPGLEIDTTLGFAYSIDTEDLTGVSGMGDSEILLKYRFLGDGDGPNNLAVELKTLLPSGEEEKGLSEGDKMIPAAFLIGTVGDGSLRALFNAGAIFLPDDRDLLLYGTALEWSVSEKFVLAGEVQGEADVELSDDESLMMARVGSLYSPVEGLTLSAGLGTGLNDTSPDLHCNFAVLVGW
jgi:hypothetical protein